MLDEVFQRPWPVPPRDYALTQRWADLAFLHWPVDPERLARLLPEGVQLDIHEGQAWVGVVPFRMEEVEVRAVGPLPGVSTFPELNVRTYVRVQGRPGIWFFSLEASFVPAVWVARKVFHLPYFWARMSCRELSGQVQYRSQRRGPGRPDARFQASYCPCGGAFQTRPGTLEHWLTARYCFFTTDRRGRLATGEVDHGPWTLRPGQVEIQENTLFQAAGISAGGPPALVHFSSSLDVKAWTLDWV